MRLIFHLIILAINEVSSLIKSDLFCPDIISTAKRPSMYYGTTKGGGGSQKTPKAWLHNTWMIHNFTIEISMCKVSILSLRKAL